MDSITETSLQALICKATDARNKGVDNAAVDAFCGIVSRNPEYAYIASKLVIARIQSPDEWEALQALSVLETCMRKIGPSFQNEVGKFRFLNELIKLVSPKYFGPKTSPKVQEIVISILHSWAVNYPNEPKIKEAFEMLKKQGVILVIKKPASAPSKNHLCIDYEFENKLKKLLNSKNPEDLDAANRMIKNRVLENERRATDLERVRTNVRLLEEIVGNCQPGAVPPEDLQLMEVIHSECERLRPVIFRLAEDAQESEILNIILALSEDMTQVFEKYAKVISQSDGSEQRPTSSSPSSLLDLSSPVEERDLPIPQSIRPVDDLLGASNSVLDLNSSTRALVAPSLLPPPENSVPVGNDLDQLGAIFGAISTSSSAKTSMNIPLRHPPPPVERTNKQKALDELDVLGESLLQQCKNDIHSPKEVEASFSRNGDAVDDEIIDLTGPKSLDEVLLDLGEEPLVTEEHACPSAVTVTNGTPAHSTNIVAPVAEPVIQVKPLTDVSVTLEKIAPSDVPPLRVLDSSNGVGIVLHLARDSPRDDVLVYVVTTTTTSNLPLSDYLFQVVVPKGCKFKLQPPSATSLPAHNPFLPPAAITQILLIANPSALKLNLTFMLSFTREDETVTEVGEIPELPTMRK